jgi:tetratricopeptide (TPR) repeat protein
MRSTLLVLTGLISAVTGCAPRTPLAGPLPSDLSALEARRAAHPNDPRILTDVGVAFYQAGAFDRARDVLLAALVLEPGDIRATIHLGLAYEELAEPEQALAAYRRALAHALNRAERQGVEGRLAVLARQVLALEARRSIAAEQTLSGRAPTPNTVAVLPWTYIGADSSLKPLERGLAHLVVTDLAKVSRLTLLERDRVQALADELALAGAGRVDSGTAARSGRLLGAAEVIQGAIRETGGGDIRLDANVVSSANASVRASGSASDNLSRLFAMEKSVVFDLLERWGIPLTPAEQRAIREQPTADLQAFLAFSRGLVAEDRGDFAQAGRQYQEAVGRDPSFSAARERSARSARTAAASRTRGPQLAVGMTRRAPSLRSAQLGAAIQNIAPTLAGRLSRTQLKAAFALRSRLAEALRQDDPSRLGTLTTTVTTIPRL